MTTTCTSTRAPRWAVPVAALVVLAGGATGAAAEEQVADDGPVAACQRAYQQRGEEPTDPELVTTMLRLAGTTAGDRIVDLGAGDGVVPIAAAREFGATARGIADDPDLVQLGRCMSKAEGVADKATIDHGDLFQQDFSSATVVTLDLEPKPSLCLRHRLLAMRPGSRVVSHELPMGGWEPDETSAAPPGESRDPAYLRIVPAQVDGIWELRTTDGVKLSVDLHQRFQAVGGSATFGSATHPLVGAELHGDRIGFELSSEDGATWTFHGHVSGDAIAGTLEHDDRVRTVNGRLKGELRSGAWAEMVSGCDVYYPSDDAR